MTTRARLQNANDSKSLWNYTLSPGWTNIDAHVLRMAIMRYGCGGWKSISRHFPGKNCNQLNQQTQRLFGQQALAEFQKVHLDPKPIKVKNDAIPNAFRKNGCVINEGNNLVAEERNRRKAAHLKNSGIPEELWQQLVIPVLLDPPSKRKSMVDDIETLREMYRCMYDIELRTKALEEEAKNPTTSKSKTSSKAKPKKEASKSTSTNSNSNNTNVKAAAASDCAVVTNASMDVEVGSVQEMEEDENKAMKEKEKEVIAAIAPAADMDPDVALAMALSASMESANITTPAAESKKKKKKKTGSKKKSVRKSAAKGRKRKKTSDEEEYSPAGDKPKRKRQKKK